jgi:zinc D-Ala-D-Ala carboxypeptidase
MRNFLAWLRALFAPDPIPPPAADVLGAATLPGVVVPPRAHPGPVDYPSWRLVDLGEWTKRWPNFSPQELACKGTGALKIDAKALDALQALRVAVGKPMRITSAYRSPSHNRKVGGAVHSRHLISDAFDVQMPGHDPAAFEIAARRAGFTGFGYYPHSATPFMHIDMGPARTWGTRF